MKFYGYFRSSAAFRLRIAMNLKGLSAEPVLVNLQAGDQSGSGYLSVNPQGRVPALEVDGHVLVQSLAIIEYLEETHPEPAFMPSDALGRARVRGLANLISCDIHPLNNLAVLNYLRDTLSASEDQRNEWYRHWVKQGFDGLEPMLAGNAATGKFCHGDQPGLADICLVPQVFNAQRFDCPLEGYPTLMGIFENCMAEEAFEAAHPMNQPEAETLA